MYFYKYEFFISNSQELGSNMYTAKLVIEEFTLDDSKKLYSLLVQNNIGETEYQIRLSEHEPPLGKYILVSLFCVLRYY